METVTISLQTFRTEHDMCKELSTLQNVAPVSTIIHSGDDVTLRLQDWGGGRQAPGWHRGARDLP